MLSKLTFQKRYFLLAILLFLTEVIIAIYVHDKIVRPYIGDVLVVIFLYCLLKSFFIIPFLPAAFFVLAFSFFIETLQYFQIVNRLGLEHSRIARIIIGTSFEWFDFVSYIAGIIIVVMVEKIVSNQKLFSK